MSKTPLSDLVAQVATRQRAADFSAFGMVLPNPDPILKAKGRDVSVYRDLLVDAHVGGCVRRRKSAVKALDRGLDRGKSPSRTAKAVESILAGLDMDRIIGEMMEAPLYGYQALEIDWQIRDGLLVPADVVGKPQEWFAFSADNELRLRTRQATVAGEALPARKFLLPRQDATYQNPYGFADLSMCFWPVFFKKGGVRLWLAFVEKFGGANWVGKLPRNAQPAERDELLDSLEELISNGVAVIPDDGSVAPLEVAGKAASADLYERLVMFCRSEVSIALTGTNQTTEANSNKASASAGLEVARDLRDGDAAIVSAAINQLIRWIVDLNFGEAVPAPVWSLWDQEEQDRLQASRDKSNYNAGARFTNDYWMRAYGYQEGDLLEPAPGAGAAAQPTAGSPPATQRAAHAQGINAESGDSDPLADDIESLAASSGAAWEGMVAALQSMVDNASDMRALQAQMLNAYGALDSEELTRLMAAAFALAELKGMADVVDGR